MATLFLNSKKIILLSFLIWLLTAGFVFAQEQTNQSETKNSTPALKPTPCLTPEQIARHPADPWYTAPRPDYSALDERVKTLGKTEETPEAVAKVVCEGLQTEIEKARAIFDWLCYNIAYDTSYRIYKVDETFKKRKGVCQGYADLYETMADSVGLTCRCIHGLGNGSGRNGHAWNIVYLSEGRPVMIDACWGAGGVNGNFFRFKFDPSWFDTHPAVFAYDHLPANQSDQYMFPVFPEEKFKQIYHIRAEHYLPYGSIDPLDSYCERLKYPSDAIPAVSLTSGKNSKLRYKYISTGPSLTDGFFMYNHEECQKEFSLNTKNDDYKTYLKGNFQDDYSPVVNLPLNVIAEYLNNLSQSSDMEKCFTITDDGQVFLDLTKEGFRIPTKKEFLLALKSQSDLKNIQIIDFAKTAWFYDNHADFVHSINERKENDAGFFDLLGNANELCWDEETNQFVLMGGCVTDSMESILALEAIPYSPKIIEKTGYCGFRRVFNAPKSAKLQCGVALKYYNGKFLDKSEELYNAWLDLSIKQNYAEAIAQKGTDFYYSNEKGSLDKAYELFMKAAEQNNPMALHFLGEMYRKGDGVTQNYELAIKYLEKASELDYFYTPYKLSQLYRFNEPVGQDLEKYFYYLKKAFDIGFKSEDSMVELGICYAYGAGCQKDEKKGFKLIEEAREKYNKILSIVNYADCFAEGIGVRKNWNTAASEYIKAADMGSLYAMEKLADCYFNGNGVDRNFDKVMEYYNILVQNDYHKELTQTKIQLLEVMKQGIDCFGKESESYFASIPNGENFGEYLNISLTISSAVKNIAEYDLNNLSVFQNLTLEQLQNKVAAPLEKVLNGEPLSGKTLVVIMPKKGSKWSNLENQIFTTKSFCQKAYRVNGENYKYDDAFFDYYDNLLIFEEPEQGITALDKCFEKLLPSVSSCSKVDFMTFSTALFSVDSKTGKLKNADAAYVSAFRQIVQNQIAKGNRPRIIAFGNKTDSLQTGINAVFTPEESEQINVFGTPCSMKGQIACGFRSGNLFVVLLTEKYNSKNLLIYLDETGWAPEPTRQDKTFVQSSQNLTKMTNLAYGKGGTVTKNGKMVMHYKVVKESKR